MLERILPPGIVLAEANDDLEGELLGAERAVVAQARPVRQREFLTGRLCARRALAELKVEPVPLPRCPDGSVDWPVGVVGSITHCVGYRAAAVGRSERFSGIGIDAEPNEPLPAGVLDSIAGGDERSWIRGLPNDVNVHWDRLLFSAKESIVKVVGEPIRDWRAIVVRIIPLGGAFMAYIRLDRPRTMSGRWTADERFLGTAVVLPGVGA